MKLVVGFLKLIAWLLVVAIPLLGVWVASSIAAYLDGPVWLACAAGLLLFPILPLGWDVWGSRRFAKKQARRLEDGKERRGRIVTFGDRMILRTLFLNAGFLAVLLASHPQVGFTALAARGDWFLDEVDPPTATAVRPVLFAGAEKLEWLYDLSHRNPYAKWEDDAPTPGPSPEAFGETTVGAKADARTPAKKARPAEENQESTVVAKQAPREENAPAKKSPTDAEKPSKKIVIDHVNETKPSPAKRPKPRSRPAGEPPSWPMKARLHPAVEHLPPGVDKSYASVARYIAQKEHDPFQRVKALHDWVAHNIAYDVPALRSGHFPPQTAKAVFDRKKAVCAGYSRLLEAMGKVTGDQIVYIAGDSRDLNGSIAGGGHAWNAAKIGGKWYLIDATWDAGNVSGPTFHPHYTTRFLFTPPKIFGHTHHPDDDHWQLRRDPLSRAEFVRQPMLRPMFFARHLELLSPRRSQVAASGGVVTVRLENPDQVRVSASIQPAGATGKGHRVPCVSARRHHVNVFTCRANQPGLHRLNLYAGPRRSRSLSLVGTFEVTR